MQCQKHNCNGECIEVRWNDEIPSRALHCPICGTIYLMSGDETIEIKYPGEVSKPSEVIPTLALETAIYINNKEHKFFLEQGKIVDKSHLHYRIKFISLNKDINNSCLWVPEHWISVVPPELL